MVYKFGTNADDVLRLSSTVETFAFSSSPHAVCNWPLKMDNKSQAAFMRKFGDPYVHKSVKSAEDLAEVMKISVDKDSKYVFGAEALHADITYEQLPAQWTCLWVPRLNSLPTSWTC